MSMSSSIGKLGRLLWPVAAAALAGALLWKLPEWQTEAWRGGLTRSELLMLQNELRQTLILLFGAAVLVGTAAIFWRRVTAGEAAARESLQLAQENQRADHYHRAVMQLADERIEVRLGAIYALETIAADSTSQRGPVHSVLCAYLRDRAGWEPDRPQPARLPLDIQEVLSLLGRRPRAASPDAETRLDLRRTDLRGADLDGLNFERAQFNDAHLEGASLQGACLSGADLRGAHLNNADLVTADLRRADLREAHLEAAYMVEAHLEGADLGGAHMAGAYLGGAHMQGADLGGAHLDGAYMYKAQLDGASLHGARVVSAIGVRRDERERVNRTAAEIDDPTPAEAPAPPPMPPPMLAPARKPLTLRSEPPALVIAEQQQRRRGAG